MTPANVPARNPGPSPAVGTGMNMDLLSFEMARSAFDDRRFTEAVRSLEPLVERNPDDRSLRELLARVSGTLGAVLLVVTALGLLFAPQLAEVFAPHDPHKFGLLVQLIRLTFPFLLFVSLTALAGGVLNSFLG